MNRDSKNGYVICQNCGGYYELQEGESPEDFSSCECGGTLEYINNFKEPKSSDTIVKSPKTNDSSNTDPNVSKSKINIIALIIGGAICILLLFTNSFIPDLGPIFAVFVSCLVVGWILYRREGNLGKVINGLIIAIIPVIYTVITMFSTSKSSELLDAQANWTMDPLLYFGSIVLLVIIAPLSVMLGVKMRTKIMSTL